MPYEAEKKGQEHLKESALMVRCGTGRSHMLSSSQEGEWPYFPSCLSAE